MTRLLLLLTALLLAAPAVGLAAEGAGEHVAPGIAEDLSLWGLVAFVLFFLTCLKLLGGWAVQSLADREQTEVAYIAEAEQKNQLAQQALSERKGQMEAISEEIDETLAEARRDADHTRSDITAVANREADILRNRANSEIGRVGRQALNDLFSTMATRVVEQTEAGMKERLNESEHNRLIDEALGHFAKS